MRVLVAIAALAIFSGRPALGLTAAEARDDADAIAATSGMPAGQAQTIPSASGPIWVNGAIVIFEDSRPDGGDATDGLNVTAGPQVGPGPQVGSGPEVGEGPQVGGTPADAGAR